MISEFAIPFYPEVIRGFQAAAWDHGLDVLLLNTEYSRPRTDSLMRKLVEKDVRGVAILTSSIAMAGCKPLRVYVFVITELIDDRENARSGLVSNIVRIV